MNGDISRIPIQSLGAVVSLTDILPELPLPAPIHQTNCSNNSLLWESQLSENAFNLINHPGSEFVRTTLTTALCGANTDNIDFQESFTIDNVSIHSVPSLLSGVILNNIELFQNKRGFTGIPTVAESLTAKACCDAMSSSWLNDEVSSLKYELQESPTKKKKKRKKKKHKHRDADGGDTSETGGESSATTPATHDDTGHKSDISTSSPIPTYGVVADTNKLSLKIFKRPVNDVTASFTTSPPMNEKKEKKKKKSKDRDRKSKKSKSSKSRDEPENQTLVNNIDSDHQPHVNNLSEESKLTLESPGVIESRAPVPLPQTTVDLPASTTDTGGVDFQQTDSNYIPYAHAPSQSTSSLQSTPASVEHSACSIAAPVSSVPAGYSCPITMSNHSYCPPSHMFDGILNDAIHPTMSFLDSNNVSSNDAAATAASVAATMSSMSNIVDYLISSNSFCDTFPSLGSTGNAVHGEDQSTAAAGSDSTGLHSTPHDNPFSSSFMIDSHLADALPMPSHAPSQQAVNIMPDFGLSVPPFGQLSDMLHSPTAFAAHNFDLANLTSESHTHEPMGLASYLSVPGQAVPQAAAAPPTQRSVPRVNASGTNALHASWRRKSTGPMRRRKRKNELEDLQQWTVNYPTGSNKAVTGAATASADRVPEERTWDQTIGRYSQQLAKRRKRMARQTGNFDPAYVFEHDKDYPSGKDSDTGEPSGAIDITNDSDNDGACSRGLRVSAAQRSYAGMDDDEEGADGVVTGGEHNRRRRKIDDDEPFEVRLKEPIEARFPHLMRKSSETARKRRERVGFGGLSANSSSTNPSAKRPVTANMEFGAEPASLKRFLNRLQTILDSVEDCDLLQNTGLNADHDNGDRQSSMGPSIAVSNLKEDGRSSEAMLPPDELNEFCRDAAKLNATQLANQIPVEQLTKLVTLLLINIRDGASVTATLSAEEEADEQEYRLWRQLAMERVMRSVNAGLTGLSLMTAKDMPREVYVEDLIEKTVETVRFQLFRCIYPEFDPAYRVVNTAKENQSSIRSRRARERDSHKPRDIIHLYHKLVEIVANLAKLVRIQRLTDGLVLSLSSIGVSVFFVENVSELQLAALELVTVIFSQYEPHRKLIMEEILASLARLPSSKRNLRSYRLNSEDNIQMLTALSLLLVQSVIELPTPVDSKQSLSDAKTAGVKQDDSGNPQPTENTDDELAVSTSYQNALRTAHTFLLVFLRKSTVKGEDDYRIIFENFVNDLLLAVNKPDWPAAEVMLSLLGSLLVQQFNNKTLDQSVRVASVDYLGTVASTLRRDAVTSQMKENDIDGVIRDLLDNSQSEDDEEEDEEEEEEKDGVNTKDNEEIKQEQNGLDAESHKPSKPEPTNQNGPVNDVRKIKQKNKSVVLTKKSTCKKDEPVDPITQLDRVQALRDSILDYLAVEDASPTAIYARKFYLAQWLNDCTKECERAQQAVRQNENLVNGGDATSIKRASRKLSASDQELVYELAEQRRKHILYKIRESPDTWRQRRHLWNAPSLSGSRRGVKSESNQVNPLVFHGTLDYEDACLVCRYLASLRPFSQSFDVYLSQICKLLSESSVPVRTKALRCLSAVVEADPNVLARLDIERAVHSRLLDTSTSVREAAVDLLGRFLGRKPELTTQYYPMLAERIRDKGVSVRKRVIRILRDICLEQPDFPKVAEICVSMIRRVNDEEGIKKLINEVFQTMWFSPLREKETVKLIRKVMNITDVVAACKDTGNEWFEQFLRTLLKKDEADRDKTVEKACKQIVDCLVQYIMRLEEISAQNNQRLIACLATLHLFTKIRPDLMVENAMVLQPYLRCNEASDSYVLFYVARILEVTVPLMEHPSETFVAQLEEDMVRLTLRHGKMVLESCVACLGSVVNRVSKNYSLARDCFTRLFNALQRFRTDLATDPERKVAPNTRPSILRALFTVGLLCKHFDADVFQSKPNSNIRDQVFELLMFFTEQIKSDLEMRKKALSGLGFLCTRHHELLCGTKLREFYHTLLQTDPNGAASNEADIEEDTTAVATPTQTTAHHNLELKCIVLENLLNFFLEEERRMLDADAKWKARQHKESLKEMGDVASGMGSSVAQTYLKDILETFFSSFMNVRLTALSVVNTILRQGLIHPVQTVPYLIAMQTDLDLNVRSKADAQLQEIDHRFPGFLSMRAVQGVSFSFRLQFILYPELLQMASQKSQVSSQSMLSPDDRSGHSKSDPSQPVRRSHRHRGSTADLVEDCQPPNGIEDKPVQSFDNTATTSQEISTLEGAFESIRGTRDPLSEIPGALNAHLYSMLRGNRGQRRSLLSGLIGSFDESQTSSKHLPLSQLIYIVDNLAHFPYQCQDEPLYVIHQIDLMVSMSGSGVLQSVRETLFPELKVALDTALEAQAEAEMRNRAQVELQLRTELQTLQAGSTEAIARGDHCLAEQYSIQMQVIAQKLNTLLNSNPSNFGAGTGTSMNELRSVAMVWRESIPQVDLGPLEEEEEDTNAMLRRLDASKSTALPIMRDAIRISRACVLLLTLKQFLKEVYSITDAKLQRYSPTDSVKVWERPLTRRAGVRFNPGPCLQAAGVELRKLLSLTRASGVQLSSSDWPPVIDKSDDYTHEEQFAGEMEALIHDYLDFRKLILTIDPPGDDDLAMGDDLNTSNVSNSGLPTTSVTNSEQPAVPVNLTRPMNTRSRPTRTLVPQSHNKSSEDENDSEDSNDGGASRLLLAQSAPTRRRKPVLGMRPTAGRSGASRSVPKRKKRKRRPMHGSSSTEDEGTDSAEESDASDPDF